MGRSRIRVVHLGGVHVLVVTACALAQSRVLDQLFIFHRGLVHPSHNDKDHEQGGGVAGTYTLGACARDNIVEDWLHHLRLFF